MTPEHAVDLLFRGARGELSAAEAADLAALAEQDPSFAELLDVACSLAEHAAVREAHVEPQGCPEAVEVVALAEGGLDDARCRDVLAHVGDCDRCLELLDAALAERRAIAAELASDAGGAGVSTGVGGAGGSRSGASGASVPGTSEEAILVESLRAEARFLVDSSDGVATRPPVRVAWRPWLAAAAVVLLALTWWVARSDRTAGPDEPSAAVIALAQVQSLPVRHFRDLPDPGSPQAQLREGLAAYARRDWPRAVAALQRFVAADAVAAEAWLYLGSAELLRGQPRAALPALELAERHGSDDVASEARWQQAQARLLAGDRPAAAALLDDVIAAGGPHAEAARAQRMALATIASGE